MAKLNQFEIDLFKACLKNWGVESQLMMLIEECAELIHSVSKDLYRNFPEKTLMDRLSHFAEELADVQLMIDELTYHYGLEDDVKYYRIVKMERLQKILDNDRLKMGTKKFGAV